MKLFGRLYDGDVLPRWGIYFYITRLWSDTGGILVQGSLWIAIGRFVIRLTFGER